jgi:hypothetical protein
MMKRKSFSVASLQTNFGKFGVFVRGDLKDVVFSSGSLRIYLFKLTLKRQTDVPFENFSDFINR